MASAWQPLRFDEGVLRASAAGVDRARSGGLKRRSAAEEDAPYETYRPALTLAGVEREETYDPAAPGLGDVPKSARRARAFDWKGRTAAWWLSDHTHRLQGILTYPMEAYVVLMPIAMRSGERVATVRWHVRDAAQRSGRAPLSEADEVRYTRRRAVEVFLDELDAAQEAGDAAFAAWGLGALKRAVDVAFAAEEERVVPTSLLPQQLPREAPWRDVEVRRETREEARARRAVEAERAREALEKKRSLASQYVDLVGLPAPDPRAPKPPPAATRGRAHHHHPRGGSARALSR